MTKGEDLWAVLFEGEQQIAHQEMLLKRLAEKRSGMVNDTPDRR